MNNRSVSNLGIDHRLGIDHIHDGVCDRFALIVALASAKRLDQYNVLFLNGSHIITALGREQVLQKFLQLAVTLRFDQENDTVNIRLYM